MFPVLPLTVFFFLNLFNLPECLVMGLTSMQLNKILTEKLFPQGYRYHKLRENFKIFIADTMNWFKNSKSD